MVVIPASLVKELREKTGAGMMDCKKALTETAGDIETAIGWLRKKGLATAAKKAGRVASEGLVAVAVAERVGAVVEVNAETDFVARNESFQEFAKTVADIAMDTGDDLAALKGAAYPGIGKTVQERLTELIASIGENMNVRRAGVLSVDSGLIASYVHNALAPELGRIGVLVALECAAEPSRIEALGKRLAMHVAASSPQVVSRKDVDAATLEREREILAEQARATGKPEDILAKVVEGRLRRFYEEVCMLEQTYVVDGESKVSEVVESAAEDLGAAVSVKGFVRFALGEGVDKKKGDFAAEIALALGD